MANPERSGDGNYNDLNIDNVAFYLAGRINKEDLSEENQLLLNFCINLMFDDPRFAERVNKRKNQLLEKGIKRPLYSDEDLKNAKRHRRRKKHTEPGLQPRLWEDLKPEKENKFGIEKVTDPMGRFYREVGKIEKSHYGFDNSVIDQETKKKRMELRDMIGLPVARGKDPHVNDGFYKYLVRKVYVWDTFGIFNEYDKVAGDMPESLNEKIGQVKNMLSKVLDPKLGVGERHKMFNQFIRDHDEH